MKRQLFFGLLIGILSLATVSAQITILSTDMVTVGDTIPRGVDTLGLHTQGPSGPNQNWNFSTAYPHKQVLTVALSPGSTPYDNDFPGSTVALTNDNVNYLYLEKTASILNLDGIAGDLLGNGTPLSAIFSPDVTLNNFPMIFGNDYSDTYAFDAIAPGNGFDLFFGFSVYQVRLQHSATTFDTIDSWGVVSTPHFSYNCLRNKHVEFSHDVILYKLFAFTGWTTYQALDDTTVTYSWIAKESGLAVAELNFNDDGSPNDLTYFRDPAHAVGVEKEIANENLSVFPNPCRGTLNIASGKRNGGEYFSWTIYDLQGKTMQKGSSRLDQTGLGRIDCQGLDTGCYFYEISFGDESNSSWGKFLLID